MVQADEILLTQLAPLFSPASVASALTALQQRGEEFLLSLQDPNNKNKNNKIRTLYSTAAGCRSARSQFMLSTLVALRKRVAASPRHLIKKWCNSVASRTSIEIQLRNDEMKIKKAYLSSEEAEKEEERKLQQTLGRDVSFTEVIEIPCLLLLCSFAVTFLPGIECVETRSRIFSDAVKLAQADGDLIVRDDVTLEEVIEFGLDVAGTSRSRWLPTNEKNRFDENNYLGVKVMTLLWSLMLKGDTAAATANTKNNNISSPLISVLADPHLLLWSSYSALACPDAIVIESADEAKLVLDPQDDQQQQCNELFDNNNTNNNNNTSLGVVILLVSESRGWTLQSLISTCENVLTKNTATRAFSIWIDSHECSDLLDSVSTLGRFSMLQWTADGRRIASKTSFAEFWITKTISSSAFPVPITDTHQHHNQRNVIAAATASFQALKESATSICSDEFSKLICNKPVNLHDKNDENELDDNRNDDDDEQAIDSCCSCFCSIGLLSFLIVRLPDIVPTYSQAILTSCAVVTSPQERKLNSIRAASPPLPPGISMAPDALYLYRLGEQIPQDFFFSFWTRLLLNTSSSSSSSSSSLEGERNNTKNNNVAESKWKPDLALVKMNSAYQMNFGSSSRTNANSAPASNMLASSSLTSISSSAGMCKAFSFVLSSWCEENVKRQQDEGENQSKNNIITSEQLIEESVGRLKSVADVIDRHRTVEMRAFQQTVAASKMELKALMAALESKGATTSSTTNSSQSSPFIDEPITTTGNSNSSIPHYITIIAESSSSRAELSKNWRNTKSFAKKNFRAVMIVLQQVGQVFEVEAKRVVSKLLEGGRGVLPMIVLRMRSELEMVASYYDVTMNTAVKALGVKGKRLLWVSDEFQENMKVIRAAL